MKVNPRWCATEYQELEKLKQELAERQERLRDAAFQLADKLDRSQGNRDDVSKTFTVDVAGQQIRFTKIANVKVSVLGDTIKKLLGSKANRFKKTEFKVDKKSLETLWKEATPEMRKHFKNALNPTVSFDPELVNTAYQNEEITKTQFMTVTEKFVSHSLRITPSKVKIT